MADLVLSFILKMANLEYVLFCLRVKEKTMKKMIKTLEETSGLQPTVKARLMYHLDRNSTFTILTEMVYFMFESNNL